MNIYAYLRISMNINECLRISVNIGYAYDYLRMRMNIYKYLFEYRISHGRTTEGFDWVPTWLLDAVEPWPTLVFFRRPSRCSFWAMMTFITVVKYSTASRVLVKPPSLPPRITGTVIIITMSGCLKVLS